MSENKNAKKKTCLDCDYVQVCAAHRALDLSSVEGVRTVGGTMAVLVGKEFRQFRDEAFELFALYCQYYRP